MHFGPVELCICAVRLPRHRGSLWGAGAENDEQKATRLQNPVVDSKPPERLRVVKRLGESTMNHLALQGYYERREAAG